MTKRDHRELLGLVESDETQALWAISDTIFGKDLLLKTSWRGTLDLENKAQMERFERYTARRAK